jgi:hypothetical protein
MVVFPAGRYAVTSPVTVTADNVVLIGEGAASRIFRLNSDDTFPIVYFDGPAGHLWNCGVDSLALGAGNVAPPAQKGDGAIVLLNTVQFDISRCYVEQPGGSGIKLMDSYIGSVSGNRIRFCDDALHLVGVANALQISGNRMQSNNGAGILAPISEWSPGHHWPQMMGCHIAGNDIEGNGGDGIRFTNALYMGNVITGNYFELNHNPSRSTTGNGPHIYKAPAGGTPGLRDEFRGINIIGNFFGNKFPPPDDDSIVINAGADVAIMGNAYWTGSFVSDRDAVRVADGVANWFNGPGATAALSAHGDVSVGSQHGIVLTAPGGGTYRVQVGDDGQLSTVPL